MAANWQPYSFLISLSLISQTHELKNKQNNFLDHNKNSKNFGDWLLFLCLFDGLTCCIGDLFNIYVDSLNFRLFEQREENSKEKKSLKRQIKGRLLKNKSTNFFYSCFKSNYYRESYSINLVA
jgi:hypothetical protein